MYNAKPMVNTIPIAPITNALILPHILSDCLKWSQLINGNGFYSTQKSPIFIRLIGIVELHTAEKINRKFKVSIYYYYY